MTRNTASLSSAHGILGLNPDPFTLRELVLMVEGKGRFDWAQTSSLMALAVNLMRDPKKGKAEGLGRDPGEYVAVNMSLSVKSWCDILRAE